MLNWQTSYSSNTKTDWRSITTIERIEDQSLRWSAVWKTFCGLPSNRLMTYWFTDIDLLWFWHWEMFYGFLLTENGFVTYLFIVRKKGFRRFHSWVKSMFTSGISKCLRPSAASSVAFQICHSKVSRIINVIVYRVARKTHCGNYP